MNSNVQNYLFLLGISITAVGCPEPGGSRTDDGTGGNDSTTGDDSNTSLSGDDETSAGSGGAETGSSGDTGSDSLDTGGETGDSSGSASADTGSGDSSSSDSGGSDSSGSEGSDSGDSTGEPANGCQLYADFIANCYGAQYTELAYGYCQDYVEYYSGISEACGGAVEDFFACISTLECGESPDMDCAEQIQTAQAACAPQ